ncbi:MAG: universal stress protein [Elusimicrobia bacterium]|nr:universal stress protein [Elusimicrobiota bacterium]
MRAKRSNRPKVLLAWDIENPAPAALSAVRRLIEGGAKARAVYVGSPSFKAMPEWDRRTLRAAWREKLRKQGIELAFEEGGVIPRLLTFIDEAKPDLVVLGTKSSGWIESLLLGSVAKSVRRRSSAPVLIVPAGKRG